MKTIGSVESFTGGLFASKIISNPGASLYFKGSLVLYNSELKKKFGIDISNGTVSEKTALSMAKVGRDILGVDICVAFTGVAGPTKVEDKPIGLVYISINDQVYCEHFDGSRDDIRNQAVEFSLKKIKLL